MKMWGAVTALFGIAAWSAGAGEIVPLAGKVEAAPAGQFFSTYFLRDAESGILISGLKDPRGLLSAGREEILAQAELQDGPEVNGLPIYSIVEVLPDYWEQPASWNLEFRSAAGFAGSRVGIQAKDFGGAPFSMVRAYARDNGLPPARLGLPTDLAGAPGLLIAGFLPDRAGFSTTFQVFAGLQYDLLSTPSLDEAPQTVATAFATVDGVLTLTAPSAAGNSFYLIRASVP